jgi:hypothetical protein
MFFIINCSVSQDVFGSLLINVLARIIHESLAATTDKAVLPGVLGCSFDRLRTGSPCDVPFWYASEPIPRYRGTVARGHAHLRGLATAIHEISGLGGASCFISWVFSFFTRVRARVFRQLPICLMSTRLSLLRRI